MSTAPGQAPPVVTVMGLSIALRSKMAKRALWKGAISFGLVHIPVSLHTATEDSGIDFDWLDKRSMDPIGYKRINKRTGKEIDSRNIVKGVAYRKGEYVVLSDQEIAAAFPKATKTIEIEAFVRAVEVPFVYLDRPYYLAPVGNSQKVYALLRETLIRSERIGIARVVIHTRQHLAAVVPSGPALVLNLLRWGSEVRSFEGLELPPAGAKATRLVERELKMAGQLVEDMSAEFDPEAYRDSFVDEVMALVKRKAGAGKTAQVTAVEEAPEGGTAEIIDLTELLQRSLRGGKAQDKTGAKTASTATKAGTATKAAKPRKGRAA